MDYEYLRSTVEKAKIGEQIAIDRLFDAMTDEPIMLKVIERDEAQQQAVVTLTYFGTILGHYTCRYDRKTFSWVRRIVNG